MGVLEDAIREHLELKRRHGASEEELDQKKTEALGPARREFEAPPDEEQLPLDEEPAPVEGETLAVGEPPLPVEDEQPPGDQGPAEPAIEEPTPVAEPALPLVTEADRAADFDEEPHKVET